MVDNIVVIFQPTGARHAALGYRGPDRIAWTKVCCRMYRENYLVKGSLKMKYNNIGSFWCRNVN